MPLRAARSEKAAARFVERQGRATACEAAEELDARVESWSSAREPEIVRDLGDLHWRYERTPQGPPLVEWLQTLRATLWQEGLREDARPSPDGIEEDGVRERRRPRPGRLVAAVAPEVPPPDGFTDAIAAT